MQIEGTTFGSITIDGKTYEHDVVIRLDGEVMKRKKKLSKKYYGTSHTLSKEEAKFVFEKGCKQLILGSGQFGNVHLSPEAEAYFEKKHCTVLVKPNENVGQWWHFGASCDQCHAALITPERSEYVSKHQVRHFWSC